MEKLQDKEIVFIFDECHRSQFGETHLRITKFFQKNQMIGFTGTPIFAKNAASNKLGKRTTSELFDKCLHKYIITDAIRDENVLKFSIEYVGKYTEKDSASNIDIEVEDIDTKELLESPERLEKITDYIIANHSRKTHSKEFNSIFAVSNIDTLIKYYQLFKEKDHKLKIATIFSYSANEDDKDANGLDESDGAHIDEKHINKHTREKLDEFMADYNAMFGTKYNTKDSKSFYNYYRNVSKRVKNRDIDILLVVNMFLTGFDAKTLNTLYVDKNLKYHGLIQAFSRTNRILDDRKSQGNIVCFRNLKNDTDEAIALFSDKNAKDTILMQSYEEYVSQIEEAIEKLKEITPTIDSVNDLIDENEILEFVKAFRNIMRIKNILESFVDFDFKDISIKEQEFEDYKSKYLDIYDRTRNDKEKVSILDDVDFELILIHKDEINVAYILKLLAKYQDTKEEDKPKKKKEIIDIINGQVELRSKKELIENFIDEHLVGVNPEDISEAFENYWNVEKEKEFNEFCEEEKLNKEQIQKVIDTYLYDGKKPLTEDIRKALKIKLKLKERKQVIPRIVDKLMKFLDRFSDF